VRGGGSGYLVVGTVNPPAMGQLPRYGREGAVRFERFTAKKSYGSLRRRALR